MCSTNIVSDEMLELCFFKFHDMTVINLYLLFYVLFIYAFVYVFVYLLLNVFVFVFFYPREECDMFGVVLSSNMDRKVDVRVKNISRK